MRYKFSPDNWLDVVVPRTSYHLGIRAASGIVAHLFEGSCHVYYEGNSYDVTDLKSWHSRMQLAAGRLLTSYPTIARLSLAPEAYKAHFIVVGQYRLSQDTLVIEPGREAQLEAWAGPALGAR